MIKKYIFYLIRWQLSTPILAIIIYYMSSYSNLLATVIANLIGGLIFFWVDKYIFVQKFKFPIWSIKERVHCCDCNKICRGYRLIKSDNYDKTNDNKPKFRCEKCSEVKNTQLKKEGIIC